MLPTEEAKAAQRRWLNELAGFKAHSHASMFEKQAKVPMIFRQLNVLLPCPTLEMMQHPSYLALMGVHHYMQPLLRSLSVYLHVSICFVNLSHRFSL
jgi:hypothetical protein